jgi:hypothetical protein
MAFMDRREFVSAALAAGGGLIAGAVAPAGARPALEQGGRAREYYELRHYQLRRGPQTRVLDDYLGQAAIPAMRRAGVGPVGVFNVMIGPRSPALTVLIAHPSIESVVALPAALAADAEYQRAGATFLDAAATNPAFVRMEISLLRAFETIPVLELPFGGGEAGRRNRIFELREYESHSEKAGEKKIEMFDTGEIAIFRRAGMMPVFFGQTLVGSRMPNLTYMLVYEDMAARDRQWAAFASDPEWRTLSSTPGFTDPEIVSNITNMYLRPTPYSEI